MEWYVIGLLAIVLGISFIPGSDPAKFEQELFRYGNQYFNCTGKMREIEARVSKNPNPTAFEVAEDLRTIRANCVPAIGPDTPPPSPTPSPTQPTGKGLQPYEVP
jgi:hypothetical protein